MISTLVSCTCNSNGGDDGGEGWAAEVVAMVNEGYSGGDGNK